MTMKINPPGPYDPTDLLQGRPRSPAFGTCRRTVSGRTGPSKWLSGKSSRRKSISKASSPFSRHRRTISGERSVHTTSSPRASERNGAAWPCTCPRSPGERRSKSSSCQALQVLRPKALFCHSRDGISVPLFSPWHRKRVLVQMRRNDSPVTERPLPVCISGRVSPGPNADCSKKPGPGLGPACAPSGPQLHPPLLKRPLMDLVHQPGNPVKAG